MQGGIVTRGQRWHLTALLLPTLLLAVPVRGWTRVLGAKLSGGELLVELEKIAPGPNGPGIYAVDDDLNLTCVITYGRHPRWSPTHTKFAFQLGLETWVADVTQAKAEPIQEVVPYLGGPHGFFSFVIPNAMEWLPEEIAVVRWGSAAYVEGSGLAVETPDVVPLRPQIPNVTPLIPDPQGSIGRVSFSADGGQIAYEQFKAVYELGAIGREVWVLDRHTGKKRRLELPGVEAVALLNPLWSPAGERIAVDCVARDYTRRTVIFDARTGQVSPVPGSQGLNWMQALEWSPGGDYLLVANGQELGMEASQVNLVEARAGEPMRYLHVLGRAFQIYRACWSPDGARVALLDGQGAYVANDDSLEVEISTLNRELELVDIPEYLRPVMIDW